MPVFSLLGWNSLTTKMLICITCGCYSLATVCWWNCGLEVLRVYGEIAVELDQECDWQSIVKSSAMWKEQWGRRSARRGIQS
jgi:hypothetical protein